MDRVDTDSGSGFMQLVEEVRHGNVEISYSEDTEIERALDRLTDKLPIMRRMPRKYLRAMILYMDYRHLRLAEQMGRASDGVSMAHYQGRLKEVLELQGLMRFFLERQLEEAEDDG